MNHVAKESVGDPVRARVAAALLTVLLLGALPTGARATPATEARIYFKAGVAFAARGKYSRALERFLTANRLAPNPNTIFNIALCLDRLKRYGEAFAYYNELLHKWRLPVADRGRARRAMSKILPRIARLRIETTPPGASIYVDRHALGSFGQTPETIAVAAGARLLILEKPGYEKATLKLQAVRGKLTKRRVVLKQIMGTVRVRSTAPGTKVWLDDQTVASVGKAPLSLSVPPGAHTVFFQAPGHWPAQRRFVIHAYGSKTIRVAMKRLPPPTGTLEVAANVMGAIVVLDGRNFGITPMLRKDVRTGAHRITVFSEGYRRWTGSFTMTRNGRVRVVVQLERLPRRKRRGPWPWITLGLTGVSAVAAAVLGGLAVSNYRRYSETESPSLSDLKRGQAYNTGADVLLGTTAAAGLATVLTFVLTKPDPARVSKGTVRVKRSNIRLRLPATRRRAVRPR